MLIDSHCHLHDREFFSAKQAEDMLKNAHKAGVDKIICVGTSHEDSLAAYEFARSHDGVYWTYGVHPEYTNKKASIPQFEALRSAPVAVLAPAARGDGPAGRGPDCVVDTSLIAIGEVGLDYHYEGYNREAQIKLFEEMLQLAADNNLPVSFHVREAFEDFLPVVSNFPTIRGVVHSFTDSKKTLKRILNETSFYVGVNGLATYSTLPLPPIERIMLETDAPFLAPLPHRGETNQPAYVADVAKWLAQKLDLPVTEVAKITTENVAELFSLTF